MTLRCGAGGGAGASSVWTGALLGWLLMAACGSSRPVDGDTHSVHEGSAGGHDADVSKMAAGAGGPDAGMPSGDAGSAGAGAAVDGGPVVQRASEYDAGSDPDRNKVQPANLCERIAEINCAGEAYCCDNPGRTLDACKQDLIKTCAGDLMLDRVAMQDNTRFDADAAERAYTELERRASKCDPTVAQWGAASDGLRGILKGSVAPGGSCKPAAAVPDPVTLGAALLSCEQPEKYACTYKTPLDAWTCEERSDAGGGCVTDNNCSDGLYCVVSVPGLAGKCTERKPVGASCDGPTQCASLFCKRGSCVKADQQAAYCLKN